MRIGLAIGSGLSLVIFGNILALFFSREIYALFHITPHIDTGGFMLFVVLPGSTVCSFAIGFLGSMLLTRKIGVRGKVRSIETRRTSGGIFFIATFFLGLIGILILEWGLFHH